MRKSTRLIKLNKLDVELATGFLENRRDSTGLYEQRGGFKDSDILAGALGEIAAARFLKRFGLRVGYPDFTNHTKKSYAADLTGPGGKHYHVKTQTKESEKKYGSSWIMQRHDPILQTAPYRHYMILCVIDMATLEVEIKGVVSVNTLVQYKHIGECKAPSFRSTKVALYMDSIQSLSRKALWGNLWKPGRRNRLKAMKNKEVK